MAGGNALQPQTQMHLLQRLSLDQHTAVDFRHKMLDRRLFATIYTAATRQNHKGEPGNFSFHFHWSLSGRKLAAADLTIEVEASDTAGNCTIVAVQVSPEV